MPPAVLARRLKGEVTRPNQVPNPLTFTIKTLAEWLANRTRDGKTALDYKNMLCDAAAYHMRPYVGRGLLDSPSQPESCPAASSPIDRLAAAAAVGNLQQVQDLLAEGIERNAESEYWGYPVQNAALNNYTNLVTLLLQPPTKDSSYSDPTNSEHANACTAALVAASSAGHNNIVQYILSSSLRPNRELLLDATIAAAENGHTDILHSLLLSQAGLPSLDNTTAEQIKTQAFFTACAQGYPKVVHMLLSEHGIEANVTNYEDTNGLHMAALGGHARVVSLLLKQGTRYYATRRGDPLYLAALNGHEDTVRVLLDAGANIDADGGNDGDVVSACARNGEVSMIRFLLSRGLVLEKMEGKGDAALEQAGEWGELEVVELLVGLGVPVDGRKGRDGPMLRAHLYGRDKAVKLLRALGATDLDLRKSDYASLQEGELLLRWNP